MPIQLNDGVFIRAEALADQLAIDKLIKQIFSDGKLAKLVSTLRENGNSTLSLVACDDNGKLIGHLLFSPVFIANEDIGVQVISSLCVHLDVASHYQIEEKLLQEGLEILYELGYSACVSIQDNALYQKFNFVDAKYFALTKAQTTTKLLVRELEQGCFERTFGELTFCAEMQKYVE